MASTTKACSSCRKVMAPSGVPRSTSTSVRRGGSDTGSRASHCDQGLPAAGGRWVGSTRWHGRVQGFNGWPASPASHISRPPGSWSSRK